MHGEGIILLSAIVLFFPRQVEDANEIASIAKQAYDASTEAYNLARQSLEEQHQTANQITVLSVQVGDMDEKLRTVKSLASQTLRDSTAAYNEALIIYQQAVSLAVPKVDYMTVEQQSRKVSKEGNRIRSEAEKMVNTNLQLLTDTAEQRVVLQDLLKNSKAQQQQLESHAEDMKLHRDRAIKAVQLGNNILSDARGTLRTLQGNYSGILLYNII